MLDRHMSRYHVSLDHLVLENYIPEPDRKDRKAPYEEPEAFLMTGGNSGKFLYRRSAGIDDPAASARSASQYGRRVAAF